MVRIFMERSVNLPTLAQVDQTSVCIEWSAVPLKYDGEGGRHVWMDVSMSFQLQMQQVKEEDVVLEESWCTQYHGPATHVQVKGLHPGRKYAMRVQQFAEDMMDPNTVVEVAPPSPVLMFQTKATCPSAMLPPILQSRDHHSLALKWSDPEENGGHPVSEYVLEGTLPPSEQEAAQMHMNSQGMFEIYRGSERAFTWKGLSPGYRYNVRVKAVNCLGDGAFSSIASFLTQPTVPDTPPKVTCTSTSADMLTIEWPQPVSHGSESVLYSIEIDDGSGRYRHVAKVHVCTLVLAKLKSDTEYKIRVCAENSEGCSPWSPVATYRTAPALEKPCTPRKLSHHRSGNASIFSWEPQGQTQGEKYVLEVAEMGDTGHDNKQLWKVRYKSDEPEYTILTLKGDLKYQCSVRAVNDAGNSSYSSPILVDMREISQNVRSPSTPRNLGYNEDLETFSWHSKPIEREDVYIFELQVGRVADLEDKRKNPWKLAYRGEESSDIGWNMERKGMYAARVRSLCGGKFSEWTTPIQFWYEGRACPDETPRLHVSVDDTGDICVEWDPLTGEGRPIHGMEYVLESSYDGHEFMQVYRGCKTQWTLSDIDPDVSYAFQVCGVNKHGFGPRSDPVRIVTKSVPPTAPKKFAVLRKDSSSIHLSWKLQEHVKIPVTCIQIEENKMDHFYKAAPVVHSINVCESHQFCEMKPGTMYTFRIRARNAHGFGPWSSNLSVETDPDVPDMPDTPRLSPSGSGNVFKAIWTYPEDNGCVITDFELGLSTSDTFEKYKVVYHGPDVSCRIQDLDFSKEYFVRVRANNSSGNGPWSNIQKIVTHGPPPNPPKKVTVCIDGGILVSWSKPVSIENASSCTGYEVEVLRYMRPSSHEGRHHRSDKKFTVVFRKFLSALQTSCRCPLPDGPHLGGEMFVRIRSVGEHGVGCGPWSKQYAISMMERMLHQSSSDVSSSSSDKVSLESSERSNADATGLKHRNTHFGESKVARKPKKHKSHFSKIRMYSEIFQEISNANHAMIGILALVCTLFGMWIGYRLITPD